MADSSKFTTSDIDQIDFIVTYHVFEGYSTKYYDNKSRPLRLGHCIFDAKSLAKWILDWSEMVYNDDIVRIKFFKFVYNALYEFSKRVFICHDVLNTDIDRQSNELVFDFIKSSNRIYDKLQHELTKCTEEMQMYCSAKVSTCKEEIKKSIVALEVLFDENRETQPIIDIVRDISVWISRFRINISKIAMNHGVLYSDL